MRVALDELRSGGMRDGSGPVWNRETSPVPPTSWTSVRVTPSSHQAPSRHRVVKRRSPDCNKPTDSPAAATRSSGSVHPVSVGSTVMSRSSCVATWG